MDSRKQKIFWFGISTAIIVGMIYFADYQRFIRALQQAKLQFLIPAFAFGLAVFPIWSYTWYSFFQQMGMNIGFYKTFKLFMAGTFFNSVTPLGQFGGEPFMAYIISKNTEYSAEEGFSAVLSADIVNAVPTLTFVIGGALFQLLFGTALRDVVVKMVYVVMIATIGGGILVYLLWFESGRIENALLNMLKRVASWAGHGQAWIAKLERRLLRVQESFSEVGDKPWRLFRTAVVAHLGFLSQVFCLALILLSLGHSFDFTPLYFTITLGSLANFSPTPGGSGTFEAAMAGLLTLFLDMSFAPALVTALLFRMTTYWPGIVIGWLSFNTLDSEVNR